MNYNSCMVEVWGLELLRVLMLLGAITLQKGIYLQRKCLLEIKKDWAPLIAAQKISLPPSMAGHLYTAIIKSDNNMDTKDCKKKQNKKLKAIKQDHGGPILQAFSSISSLHHTTKENMEEVATILVNIPEKVDGLKNIPIDWTEYEDLKIKYLEEISAITSSIEGATEKVQGTKELINKTICLSDEAAHKLHTSDYKKKLVPKIRFHMELAAKLLNINDPENFTAERPSFYHQFADYYSFLQDFVFLYAVYTNPVYFCKKCWCLMFRCESTLKKQKLVDKHLVLLDKKELALSGVLNEKRRDWFLKKYIIGTKVI
jgi:hypothetical protein